LYSTDLYDLTRLKFLQHLDLSGCMHVNHLSEILYTTSPSPITCIILEDVPTLDDDTMKAIFKCCPHVTTLNINYSGIISKHVLMDIPTTFPNMQHLFIAGQLSADDFVVENIARYCLPLLTLDVSYTGFMGHFLVKQGHNNLETLYMNGCINVPNSEMIEQIKVSCPKLENLEALNIWTQTTESKEMEEIREVDEFDREEIEVQ